MAGLKINGVAFNVDLCRDMTKGQFVKMHEQAFFKDKAPEERRILLEDAYELIQKEGRNEK